jgi:hypothetical protein
VELQLGNNPGRVTRTIALRLRQPRSVSRGFVLKAILHGNQTARQNCVGTAGFTLLVRYIVPVGGVFVLSEFQLIRSVEF